jgi:hypothetical protein
MEIQIINPKKVNVKSLKMSFDVNFKEFIIKDFKLFYNSSHEEYWVSTPSKTYETAEGKRYVPLVVFETDEQRKEVLNKICNVAKNVYQTLSEDTSEVPF